VFSLRYGLNIKCYLDGFRLRTFVQDIKLLDTVENRGYVSPPKAYLECVTSCSLIHMNFSFWTAQFEVIIIRNLGS
jgi:hypothetical protein